MSDAAASLRRRRPHLPERRRGAARAARRRPVVARGRDRRAGRAVRRRQVDACCISPDCWSGRTAARVMVDGRDAGHAVRRRAHRDPPRRDRLRLPVPPPAAGILGAGERRAAADDRRHGRGAAARERAAELLRAFGLAPRDSAICRANFRAASSSASPIARALANAPACCWPTSRPATSTSAHADACSTSCWRLVREHGRRGADRHPQSRNSPARMDRTLTLREGRVVGT